MILVSAAIIRNTAGEILICQRGAGGSCAFLWEFPGGKQEAGETAADCLVRECREELGIEIDIVALLEQTSYTYPDNKIGLSFFAAKITGAHAEQQPQRADGDRHQQHDVQRNARAVYQTAEDIAAKLIGAEPMLCIWRGERVI